MRFLLAKVNKQEVTVTQLQGSILRLSQEKEQRTTTDTLSTRPPNTQPAAAQRVTTGIFHASSSVVNGTVQSAAGTNVSSGPGTQVGAPTAVVPLFGTPSVPPAHRKTTGNTALSSYMSSSYDDTDTDNTWQVATNRRRPKRLRCDPSGPQSAGRDNVAGSGAGVTAAAAAAAAGGGSGAVRQHAKRVKTRRKPLIVGTQRSTVSATTGMTAAKPWYGKAVFCVENVDTRFTEDDLVNFVEGLSVRVFTCYKVDARRTVKQRKEGIVPKDTKTFRLCINRADCGSLLDASKWPADIAISVWHFKPKTEVEAPTESGSGDAPASGELAADDVQTVGSDVTMVGGVDEAEC